MSNVIPLFGENGTPITGEALHDGLAKSKAGTQVAVDKSKISPKITNQSQGSGSSFQAQNDKPSSSEELPFEKLYPDQNEMSLQYAMAFKLLAQAHKYANQALDEFRQGNPIDSDDAAIKLIALLPELFCCRDIGDGFGTIVISLYNGLAKLKGQPLTEDQLVNVSYAIKRLNEEPLMQFKTALELIGQVEDSGIEIEPPAYDSIAEMLSPSAASLNEASGE